MSVKFAISHSQLRNLLQDINGNYPFFPIYLFPFNGGHNTEVSQYIGKDMIQLSKPGMAHFQARQGELSNGWFGSVPPNTKNLTLTRINLRNIGII